MSAPNSSEIIIEKLTRARIHLLMKQPFWGTLATRLIMKDATEDKDASGQLWCTTAATDGRYMYYNRDFIAKLTKEETVFLIAHEVEHCVYDHMSRRGSRKPKVWNAAADYVINYELHEHRVGKLPNPKTSGVTPCFDSKYKGMFTEELYEQLLKDPNQNFPEFDIHLEPGDGKGEPMTEEERRVLRDEISAAVMQAAKVDVGNTPAGVKSMLKDWTEPQMDWREILNMQIKSMVKSDFTWQRCARKTQAMGIYLPAMKEEEKIKVHVAIDSSGSMTDSMLRDFMGEVKGIMLQFSDFELVMWCSDTQVYNEQTYTPENIDEIDEYEIMGRGGNDFNCNWNYMKEKGMVPEKFIHFTDGYDCGLGFGDPLYCDTVYVIHSNPQRNIVSPFGMTTYYDN
jgi:predicted metal-dependent peptidase